MKQRRKSIVEQLRKFPRPSEDPELLPTKKTPYNTTIRRANLPNENVLKQNKQMIDNFIRETKILGGKGQLRHYLRQTSPTAIDFGCTKRVCEVRISILNRSKIQ